MRYAFAGDRNISCNILNFLIKKGYPPLALFVGETDTSSHSSELKSLSGLEGNFIFEGNDFKKEENLKKLNDLQLDYIFGIHFPYIIPNSLLNIPAIGFLNLHPAFLPYNKGWHTPSWAILDGTPYGATLHFMAEALDEGDIIHQKELQIYWEDTADSLYNKVLELEEEVFYESFEELCSKAPRRIPQKGIGTSHNKKDLHKVQEINTDQNVNALDFINKLRALTTNKSSELAYFKVDGKKIGVKVELLQIDDLN